MEHGFLSQKGSGGRGVKEKNQNTLNKAAVKDGAVPSVTVVFRNTHEENVGQSSTGPTASESRPDVSFAALLKGKPKCKGLNFRTLTTQAGNGPNVSISLESIRVVSERSSYVRALIEIKADLELKDTIVVAMPKLTREGFYTCTVHVEYEWKPPRCTCCKVFGHIQEECPKNLGLGVAKIFKKPSQASRGVLVGPKVGMKPAKEYRPVAKNLTVNTSGNKKKGVEPTKEVTNLNPFDVLNSLVNDEELGTNGVLQIWLVRGPNLVEPHSRMLKLVVLVLLLLWGKIGEQLIIDGKFTLVDDDGKPLKGVDYLGDHDSDDKVYSVDNDMDHSMATEMVGFGTQSLLEK
ncbi:hypothetical protein Tco_0848273 [Tanacetum coccineum]